MAGNHVVVDGSNIATEGRATPSLAQLDEAVKTFIHEHPHDLVTVVVDATFGHRIDASERAMYEAAVAAGELISPPAGAIGRGDAFVLQIADRANATVLSNDSFQEFHGTYTWLFDEGRLMGGKPVPGVGWIFLMRNPVRGPASRRSVRAGKSVPARPGRTAASRPPAAKKAAAKAADKSHPATRAAKAEAPTPRAGRTQRSRRDNAPEPINEPMPFIDFVAAHPVGSTVQGVVERFASHGAYVLVDECRCYLGLKSMGDPSPRSAREVLTVGETRSFVVQSIDAPRRGIDLALPGVHLLQTERGSDVAEATARAVGSTNKQANAEEAPVSPVAKKATARKATAKKATAKKSTAKKAPAKRAAARKTAKATTKKAPARKAAAKKATTRKAAAKKAPAKRAATKKAAAKKTTARKSTAKKAR